MTVAMKKFGVGEVLGTDQDDDKDKDDEETKDG